MGGLAVSFKSCLRAGKRREGTWAEMGTDGWPWSMLVVVGWRIFRFSLSPLPLRRECDGRSLECVLKRGVLREKSIA